MTNQHPIVPPIELMHQWWSNAPDNLPSSYEQHIATQAAQWGYQQAIEELETFLRKSNDAH